MLALAAAAVIVFSLACSGGSDSPAPGSTPAGNGAPAVTATKPSAEPSPTPLPQGSVNDEPVAFGTEDGVTLRGHLYSVAGPKRRAVIFAHEFPSNQRAWQAYARELAGQGVATVTFDFRGYGETGGAKDVAKIDRDLEAAVRFLQSRDYPLVYVVGGSMGGTAALKVAARQDLAGVVTISAPPSFMGLDARQDVANVREPKLFIAARSDGDAANAVSFFLQNAPEPKQSQLFDGAAHGSDLLRVVAAKQLVFDFLTK